MQEQSYLIFVNKSLVIVAPKSLSLKSITMLRQIVISIIFITAHTHGDLSWNTQLLLNSVRTFGLKGPIGELKDVKIVDFPVEQMVKCKYMC